MKRSSTALWLGSGKEGKGELTSQSTILNKTPYSFKSRFEEGIGTNPEELIAAAHAGCFSMKLSFVLGEAGFTPTSIQTSAAISLESGVINASHLIVKATVPGITEEMFQKCALEAKTNCPVSKLLNTTITMEASLLK
ncbi:MAG TPA: OsmC family protein [Bacteroidia bacterium]|jgi:osmotically inducible protein OsmC|nr:OsmC family protein [Bacteroidia bacterium]